MAEGRGTRKGGSEIEGQRMTEKQEEGEEEVGWRQRE